MQTRNLIAMGYRAAMHVAFGRRCPVNVMLAVTNRCNGNCRYCQIPQRASEDVPTAKFLRLIDEMKAAGTVRLGIWGGEPLMREDIGVIVSHAKKHGMYVTMDSNGLLWQLRKDELRDLDHVTFAYDGRKDAHEANRGAGTHKKTLEAIESAVTIPGLKVWTLTVLTRNNLGEIDHVLDNARRLNIHAAFQVLHHNDILGTNHDDLLPTNEQYREAIRLIIQRKKEGAPISSSYRYLNYLLQWNDYATPTTVESHLGVHCKAGALYCNVDADGRVYGCSLLVGKEPAVNALDAGFRKAFDAIPKLPCESCCAACFTEYNYLYSLDPYCIAEWMRTTRR
jgi:MoaA/NifB/PqqE/SkfB family radical SAM enzyme